MLGLFITAMYQPAEQPAL